MSSSFPFYSTEPTASGPSLYHTHPRCRIANSIAEDSRILGVGTGRSECPFCFMLGQFQVNRALRGHHFTRVGGDVAAKSALAARKSSPS